MVCKDLGLLVVLQKYGAFADAVVKNGQLVTSVESIADCIDAMSEIDRRLVTFNSSKFHEFICETYRY